MFALQPELKVFTGSANRELAERICKYIGVPLGQATISSSGLKKIFGATMFSLFNRLVRQPTST